MKYVILSGGKSPAEKALTAHIKEADVFIGVDGAADVLDGFGIVPDVLIGDFDTASQASIASLERQGAKVIRFKAKKNETDTQAAVSYALHSGASQIVLLGALGTRIDHSMANIQMLVRAHREGVPARIIDEYNELCVSNTTYELRGKPGETVSILPLTADLHVSAEGLEYPLENLALPFGSSRGVSNVMLVSKAAIHISGGYALIVKTTGRA